MFERLPSHWMIALKKVGYWIWLIPVFGIPLSYYWSLGSAHADAWAWLVITVVFGVIPLLDFVVVATRPTRTSVRKYRRWRRRATTAC